MTLEQPVLEGKHVRLEPLEHRHIEGLLAAAADQSLYGWTTVPSDKAAMAAYVETALAWRDAGTAVPFATVRAADGVVIGSTRFWEIEHWSWPEGHPLPGRNLPDVCEIGWTWLTRPAIRSAANTEAKLLMLTHAFETWKVLRVCLHTDSRNERSRAAMERMGARFEGILRAHRKAVDNLPRDSARYSIIAAEWPETKQHLTGLLR
jgi:RimJ/RimL family protein N-acetyltransferase